jgi:predicted 3-demethylubiquinone-9 3-methyltransferase (glyoxalase superfamily)
MPRITPWLWFDGQALEAAEFYVSVFPNSSIVRVDRYGAEPPERAGQVLTVLFTLDGKEFAALNGGPQFPFTEAVSFEIECADQAELDHYWGRLSDGGAEVQCGWLRDRYGLSWQVVPRRFIELTQDRDPQVVERVMAQMLTMVKLDIEPLEAAARG